jgi:hypothetical protein
VSVNVFLKSAPHLREMDGISGDTVLKELADEESAAAAAADLARLLLFREHLRTHMANNGRGCRQCTHNAPTMHPQWLNMTTCPIKEELSSRRSRISSLTFVPIVSSPRPLTCAKNAAVPSHLPSAALSSECSVLRPCSHLLPALSVITHYLPL